MPPITDPHQLLVFTAARASGLAFSALPDAPVLPFTESRRARLARGVVRARAWVAAPRHRAAVRPPAAVAGPSPCG
jgi:hypothetical protein